MVNGGKKIQVSHYWPDGLRTRLRCDTRAKAEELSLSVRLAEIDGSWLGLRTSLLSRLPDDAATISRGPFDVVVDKYFSDYVVVHNKSYRSKRCFLNRFKSRWAKKPFRSINLTDVDKLVGLTDRALEALDAVPPLPGCPYVFYNPETGTRWYDCRRPWEKARETAGYPWLRIRDLRPAFAIEVSEYGGEMHFLQSVLGHSSVAVTEKHYAKFSPDSAARATLRLIEAGRATARRQEGERKAG